MVKIVLFISIIFFGISSFACISKPQKIILSGTSLEKYPVTVSGNKIIFDKGTHDEVSFSYDQKQKKWCTSVKEVGCLLDFSQGRVIMLGSSSSDDLFVNNSSGDYAKIEISEPKLIVFSVDKNGRKVENSYIEFTDHSNDIVEGVKASSSSGSKIEFLKHKNARGLSEESKDIIDLKKSITGTMACGTSPVQKSQPAKPSKTSR